MTLDRAAIFALLWAVATLVHQADDGRFATLGLDPLINVAAVGVLLRPTSLGRLGVLALLQLIATAIRLPHIMNHWALMAAVNAMILAAILPMWTAWRRGDDVRAAVLATVAPPARAALVIVYAFAALAKLNTDFLDPRLSCAPYLLRNIAALAPALPVPSARIAIWATIVIEIAVPVLLIRRGTWRAGLALGGAFHLLLALAGFYEFAAVGLALYSLFLPADATLRVPIAWPGARRPLTAIAVASAAAYALMHIWRLDLVTMLLPRLSSGSPSGRVAGLVWLPIGVATLYGLVRFTRPGAAVTATKPSTGASVAAWAVTVLVALNGAAPYLGLKTESSYTMFSNLRTEGPLWNHLVLPVDVRVFDLQNDLVRPLDASDEWLRARAHAGDRVVFFAFHHYVSRRPDLRVRYERAGAVHDVERVASDPILSRPVPYLVRKLLFFKPVPPDGRNTCKH